MIKRDYYSLLFSIILIVGVLGIVSYGFIGRSNVEGNTNMQGSILEPSDILSITGDTNFSLDVTLDNLSILESSNNGASYIDDTKNINISIAVDPNLYKSVVTCNYSIYYVPQNVYRASQASIDASLIELGFTGSDGNNSFGLTSINNLSDKTLLYSGSISTDLNTGKNSKNWELSYRFYNLDVDQVDALGQSPAGKVTIEGTGCTLN